MHSVTLVILCGVMATAGCISSESADSHLPEVPIAEKAASHLVLTGCTGMATRITSPEQGITAPVPPGWEAANGLPTVISLFAITCDHVSFGQFERGPLDLVFESHGKFQAPESCRSGDYTFLNVLARVVVDDEELAAMMSKDLGITTSVGSLHIEPSGSEIVGATSFRWTIEGGDSAVHFGRFQNPTSPIDATYRYAWAAGDRLGMVDMHWEAIEAQFEPGASPATFSPPMLLATAAVPILVGTGSIVEQFFPSGTFRFYEGYECAVPS